MSFLSSWVLLSCCNYAIDESFWSCRPFPAFPWEYCGVVGYPICLFLEVFLGANDIDFFSSKAQRVFFYCSSGKKNINNRLNKGLLLIVFLTVFPGGFKVQAKILYKLIWDDWQSLSIPGLHGTTLLLLHAGTLLSGLGKTLTTRQGHIDQT